MPSLHRIFLRRHLSQALVTDFLHGRQSLTEAGEKRAGPSWSGNDACGVLAAVVYIKYCVHTQGAHHVALTMGDLLRMEMLPGIGTRKLHLKCHRKWWKRNTRFVLP